MQGKSTNDTKQNVFPTGVAVERLLRTGFGGKGSECEERWVLRSEDVCSVFNACGHSFLKSV